MRKQTLLLLAWACATVLLPLVHSIGHELDHVHGPGGAVKVDWGKLLLGPTPHETHAHDSNHHHPGAPPHAHHHPGAPPHALPHPDHPAHRDEAPGDRKREPENPTQHGEGAPEHFNAWFDLTGPTILASETFELLSPGPRPFPHDAPELRAHRCVDQARAPPSLS